MNLRRIASLAASIALVAAVASAQAQRRSAYTYIRDVSGDATVVSGLNGTVEARRNLPISAGDELRTEDPSRVEVALADGNVLYVGGGTSVQFVSLREQQGSDDDVSAISVRDGSVVLAVLGSDDKTVPRIDTDDLTVYTNSGSRVRVNADARHGSAVVVRAGSVEVRTPANTYTVRAGNYLLAQGDAEAEIARGSFSRDRFDIWAADRLAVAVDAAQNASTQYVGEDHAGDVASLDGYGNWDYNSNYSTYVWRPTVSAGWSPYSSGSWYYTPAGLTWWSYDPWGWYPFHYGNWFFDTGWNSWCWAPGSVYSPAWVYWGYTSSFVGWCPVGWYGFYSPWWNSYYRQAGYPRGCAFAINGTFNTRRVDLRGWNFTGSNGFGTTRGRVDVTPGNRMGDRLGGQVAISSRPIVIPTRNGVGVRDGMRDFVRNAPQAIQRGTDRETQQRLEPVVARDRELPRATVDALRDRTVVADRGRLSGPGAADLAPRGATVVDRGRGGVHTETTTRIETDRSTGRTVIRNDGRTAGSESADRASRPDSRAPEARPAEPRSDATQSWRSRTGSAPADRSNGAAASRQNPDVNTAGRENREHWRSRSNGGSGSGSSNRTTTDDAGRPGRTTENGENRRGEPVPGAGEDWRSHGSGGVPPAKRVIEGSVPGRHNTDGSGRPRHRDSSPSGSSRDFSAPPSSGPREVPRPAGPAPQAAPAPQPHAEPPHASAPAPRPAPPSGSSNRPPRPH